MPVNMVLRMIVGTLKLAQTHLDACIQCTSTGTFRTRLTMVDMQLSHMIERLENITK